MLNERGVRDQLTEVRNALAKMDEEKKALQAIEGSLVRWLDLHSVQEAQLPLQAPATNGKADKFKTLGTIKFEEAIIRALRNREGNPMSSKDILAAAQGIGAKTNAKDPLKVVEWYLYDIQHKNRAPIKKLRPHIYVYMTEKRHIAGIGTFNIEEKAQSVTERLGGNDPLIEAYLKDAGS